MPFPLILPLKTFCQMRSRLILIGLLAITLAGCKSSNKLSTSNLSDIYKHNSSPIHPELIIFHQTDSLSQVHFKIPTSELLYARRSATLFTAKLVLHYELLRSFEEAEVLDSATLTLADTGYSSVDRAIIGSFTVPAKRNKHTILQVTIKDLNRHQESTVYQTVDKRDRFDRQNFLVRNAQTRIPMFSPHPGTDQSVIIECAENQSPRLYGRYYLRETPLAAPPFSVTNMKPFDYDADSLFTLLPDSADGHYHIQLKQPGIYHLCPDKESRKGLTLFHFYKGFPEVKNTHELQQPLRYVTSRKEFKALTESANPKEALDAFWLKNAANPDRARELIRNYYSRVKHANQYFSSYLEGWKTDRGMIYIVFGPPNVVYKSSGSETWIYGEENNYMSITYNFAQVDNPFTANDFALSRSPIYKTNWYRAVDIWRQGRILGSE